MKKFLCSVLLCGMAALPAIAQGAPAGPPTDPLSTFVKAQFKQVSNVLIHSAEDMPEENFGKKLGPTPEVRTYAALLGHVIDANYFFCSGAKGEKDPSTTRYETAKYDTNAQAKQTLVAAMHSALDYCAPLYDSLSDAGGMKALAPPAGGRGGPSVLFVPLVRNVIHNNEEYGNIVGYFRGFGLVPPSSAMQSGGGRRGN